MSDPCHCREARAWRAYWTTEAIAERLHEEVTLYRRLCLERWDAAIRDVRGAARMDNTPPRTGESHATLEARRAVPGVWPPRR